MILIGPVITFFLVVFLALVGILVYKLLDKFLSMSKVDPDDKEDDEEEEGNNGALVLKTEAGDEDDEEKDGNWMGHGRSNWPFW